MDLLPSPGGIQSTSALGDLSTQRGSEVAVPPWARGTSTKGSLESLTQRCHCQLPQRLHSAPKGPSLSGTRVPADPRVGFVWLNKFW